MKGTRGKLLRKLKFITSLSPLKQGLVFQPESSERLSNQNSQTPPAYKERDQKSNDLSEILLGTTGSSEHHKHTTYGEMELEFKVGNKDNFTSIATVPAKESAEVPILSLIGEQNCVTDEAKDSEEYPSLLDFEEKCPPGGSESIILYTTSLTGIRKTFENCNSIRFLLESFKVAFYERDVSMHLEYREELWSILGGRVIPPRLFIKGRYIGGADEVAGLHEQGKLRKLLEGIPLDLSSSCSGCANVRFVVCLNCSGSRKIAVDEENNELKVRCPECNENGLVQCPICC